MFSRRTLCSGEVVEKVHPEITQVSLRSDEVGCYHNNFLLAVVTDAGQRFGLTVTQYDFSEPHYGKDVCYRILCPMKSAIRRYCCEGNAVLSAKDMRTALSERPVRGTIACVCLVNETQKSLEVNEMDAFSKYHNFIFELNGIRVWRADGVGKGIVIPFQDTIVKLQGPTDLVVYVHFFQSTRLESIRLRQVMRNKEPVSSSALSLDVRWCSRNSVTLGVILMLANTVKNAGAPKRCI